MGHHTTLLYIENEKKIIFHPLLVSSLKCATLQGLETQKSFEEKHFVF